MRNLFTVLIAISWMATASANPSLDDHYVYTSDDERGLWRVMVPNTEGQYVGDCEDYALTKLYHLSKQDKKRFWENLETRYELRIYETPSGSVHTALWDNEFNLGIESTHRRWVWGSRIGTLKHTVSPELLKTLGIFQAVSAHELRTLAQR